MAARSHLFPFRTEKLSSLSPMVLNFGRVGSRRFQESISLRLTPFFVRVRAQKPAVALRATTGCGRPGTVCHLRRQERLEDSTSGAWVFWEEVLGYNHRGTENPERRISDSSATLCWNEPPLFDSSVWKMPRAERGCPGKKSRGITTEARRTLRRESL